MFMVLSHEKKQLVLDLKDPGKTQATEEVAACAGLSGEDDKKLLRIMRNNSIETCGDPELGPSEAGLYLTISRINHSCAPNVVWSWLKNDPSKRKKQVRALRRIEEGEEICACYVTPFSRLTRDERAKKLEVFSFSCLCAVCSLAGDQLNTNEAIRHLLKKLDDDVQLFSSTGRLPLALQASQQKLDLMSLLEAEELAEVSYLSQVCLIHSSFPVL